MENKELNVDKEMPESVINESCNEATASAQVSNGAASSPTSKRMTLKNIFLGDFLVHDFLRRQAILLALVVGFTVIYISNRYSCQQEMIEIDQLHKQLIDIKYDALTRSSELMERSRQSRIEEYVSTRESELQTSTSPPYVIKK